MCKHENTKGFKFCPYCGEKLPKIEKQERQGNFEKIPAHERLNKNVSGYHDINYAYKCNGEFNPVRSVFVWNEYDNNRLQRIVLDAIAIINHFEDAEFTQADVAKMFDKTVKHGTCTLFWNAGLLERVGKKVSPVYVETIKCYVNREAYIYKVVPDAKQYLQQIVFSLYTDSDKNYKHAQEEFESRLRDMDERVTQIQSLWNMIN